MRKYVSGIRPSGKLHLGNYLGAIKHWKELKKKDDCYFFIADMHGQHNELEVFRTRDALFACGVGTYIQSDFKENLGIYILD